MIEAFAFIHLLFRSRCAHAQRIVSETNLTGFFSFCCFVRRFMATVILVLVFFTIVVLAFVYIIPGIECI